MNCRPAIFLDRDGTIIEDQHYPRDPDRVVFCPNAASGLRLLMDKGYLLFVVSNQSGVGRGIIRDSEFRTVHARCSEILQQAGIAIAEFIYCFHRPEDECSCRKPKTALIPKAFKGESLDWKRSFTVGDRQSDLELAVGLGAKAFLVKTGKGAQTLQELSMSSPELPFTTCEDLLDFARQVPQI